MKDDRERCEDSEPKKIIITFNRRKELQALAAFLAEHIDEKTKPHERCLLRKMVECIIDDGRY